MNRILRCDWLPEGTRWSYPARSGLPAVSRKKKFLKSDIINASFSKLIRSVIRMSGYRPPSFLCVFMDTHKHKKELG